MQTIYIFNIYLWNTFNISVLNQSSFQYNESNRNVYLMLDSFQWKMINQDKVKSGTSKCQFCRWTKDAVDAICLCNMPPGGSWIAFDMSDGTSQREIVYFITASCKIPSRGIASRREAQYLTDILMYVLDAEVSGYHLRIIMRVKWNGCKKPRQHSGSSRSLLTLGFLSLRLER